MILNKIVKNLIILMLLMSWLGLANPVLAQNYIINIELFDMQNGQAKLNWETIEPTQAMVYWGEAENDLNKIHYYNNFDTQHIITIYGLQKNFTYFFKIVAINRGGQRIDSFLQSFSTRDMIDTVVPEVTQSRVIQTTRDAALISWTTDELTKADIFYGTRLYNLDKRAGHGFAKYHELALYNLDYSYTYYVKIIAEDESRNKKIIFLDFKMGGPFSIGRDAELKIYNVQPQTFDAELIDVDRATVKWRTNLAARSKIIYGIESGRYIKTAEPARDERNLEHQITLTDLEPNTTYYYKIQVFDSLYNKRKDSREMTLTTSVYSNQAPQILGEQTGSEYMDSDNDQLSDAYEFEIGTNPNQADSDGDGYDDGNELSHGWDPNVPGSTPETRLQASNYYKPKRPYEYRLAKDRELKLYVINRLGFNQVAAVSAQNWRVLSDAYIYGSYPAEAIVQAIRFGGKTVHPTIDWSAWRNSPQYVEYINK